MIVSLSKGGRGITPPSEGRPKDDIVTGLSDLLNCRLEALVCYFM